MSRLRATTSPGESPAQDPRFVTALARGLALLRAFHPQERWVSHRELVRRTALPAATISRLSFTLVGLGYLQHRPERGEYALGPAVLGLGFSMLGNFDIGRIARPYMQMLADACQAAVSLGARHELAMIYVAHCRSPARLTLGLDVGARLPLARTAMGRAVLCALPAHEQTVLLRGIESGSAADWEHVAQRLARAQVQFAQHGFVTSESEWEPGISAAGVPLDVGDGRAPFGLTVGGPSQRLASDFLHRFVGPQLLQTAREIVAAIHAADWKDG